MDMVEINNHDPKNLKKKIFCKAFYNWISNKNLKKK